MAEGSEHLVLSNQQKAELMGRVEALCQSLPGLFIAFPGDEDQYDGCLAAGRGFLHINPSGKVEPCPFAPFFGYRFTLWKSARCPELRFPAQYPGKSSSSQRGRGWMCSLGKQGLGGWHSNLNRIGIIRPHTMKGQVS